MSKIDLRAQVKITKPRTKRVTLPVSNVTRAEVTDLGRLYLAVMRVWAEGIRDEILPEYRASLTELITDSPSSLRAKIESINNRAVRATLVFEGLFSRWASRLAGRHLKKIIASLKYSANVDLSTQMGPRDVAGTLEDVIQRNVALVRNVSDQARGRISDIVYRGLQLRTPAREVAKEIEVALGMGRERALRIAQDQATKLAGALDAERQQQLGMDSFEWLHSRKLHPRKEHVERNGKEFRWDSVVGRTDPPGYLPFCGCKARGILEV